MTEAYELFEQILASGASSETLSIFISKLKDQEDAQKVIEHCSKALLQYPANIHLRYLLMEALFAENLLPQAEAEAEEMIANLAPFIPVYKRLAEIYLKRGKSDQAADALQKYLSLQPDDQEARNLVPALAAEQKDETARPSAAVETPALAPIETLESAPLETSPAPDAADLELPGEPELKEEIPRSFENAAEEKPLELDDKIELSELIEKDDFFTEKAESSPEEQPEGTGAMEIREEIDMPEMINEKPPLEPQRAESPIDADEKSLLGEDSEWDLNVPERVQTPAIDLPDKNALPAQSTIPPDSQADDDFYYYSATEPDEIDDLPEMATPTLAEIYLNQGLIQDAIHTYEKILLKNPGDQRAQHRVQEIKSAAPAVEPLQPKPKAKAKAQNKQKKEKLISILDDWLGKIRKIS